MQTRDLYSIHPDETDFRLFLQRELMRRCEKNKAYSLRAFAKSLDCDISSLSEILSGKRKLGKLLILRFGSRLGLNPTEVQKFLTASGSFSMGAGAEAAPNYQQLTLDTYQIIADWYHFAILELMQMNHFEPDPKWIAKKLGLRIPEVNSAIERLCRVGMLEINENKKWVDLSAGTSTTLGSDFAASALRNLQKQLIEKSALALEEVPIEFRDQSGMTMAMSSKLIPEAKERIKKFRRELATFVRRSDSLDSVYQLNISLFPLTRKESK